MKKYLPLLFLLAGCSLLRAPAPRTTEDLQHQDEQLNAVYKSAAGARIYGYDVLGLAMYCDNYLHAPHLPYASTLLNTFGDPIPCLDRGVGVHGLTDVQFDLVDATCHRNHVCPPGTPPPGDLPTIRNRARSVSAFHDRHPEVTVWASPALEHDIKDERLLRAMLNAAKEGCPSCKLINSPYSGLRLKDVPLELHGNTAKAFAVSNDGSSLFDSNSSTYRTNGSRYVAGWFPELNLRFSGEKTFTPPKKRTCKPTAALFEQANLVMKEPEPKAEFPRSCQIKKDVEAPETEKVNSESYCQGASRDNKPLYISKVKGSSGQTWNVYSAADKRIGFFRYYGPFSTKGLHRWYLGSGSGQNPVELYTQAGNSEWVFLKRQVSGRTECVRLNSIRRLGTYR